MSVSVSVTVAVQHNPGVADLLMLLLQVSCVWCEKGLAAKKSRLNERKRDRQISPSEQTPLILLLLNPSVDLLIFGWRHVTLDMRPEKVHFTLTSPSDRPTAMHEPQLI